MSVLNLFKRKKAISQPRFLDRMDEWTRDADINADNRIDIHFAKMACVATKIAREQAISQATDVSNPAMDQLVEYCFINFCSMALASFKIGNVDMDDNQAGDIVMAIRHEAIIRYFNVEINEKTAVLMMKADGFLLKMDADRPPMGVNISRVLHACFKDKDDHSNHALMGKTYGALHTIAAEYTQAISQNRSAGHIG